MTDVKLPPKFLLALADLMQNPTQMLDRAMDVVNEVQPRMLSAAEKLKPYMEHPEQAPMGPMARGTVDMGIWWSAMQIVLGKAGLEALGPEMAQLVKQMQELDKQTGHPFFQARDRQLEASRARHEIEKWLNDRPQEEIEFLADMLRQGARLKPVVQKGQVTV